MSPRIDVESGKHLALALAILAALLLTGCESGMH